MPHAVLMGLGAPVVFLDIPRRKYKAQLWSPEVTSRTKRKLLVPQSEHSSGTSMGTRGTDKEQTSPKMDFLEKPAMALDKGQVPRAHRCSQAAAGILVICGKTALALG